MKRWLCLAATALAIAAVAGVLDAGGAGQAAAQSPAVSVFPIPGEVAAPPQSQLTFRGIPISQVGQVSVVGSVSGAHTGHWAADSDGNGGSFILDQPFSPGETVTVTTNLNIADQAGGATGGTYTFTVAHPAGGFPSLHWPPAGRVPGDIQTFHSRPDLLPVSTTVHNYGDWSSGDIFLSPQWGPIQDGPMILDPNGNLVWFDHLRGNESAADFRVQSYRGQPVLTWWEGTLDAGVGIGGNVIFNSAYQQIGQVKAAGGLRADLHEFEITPWNTALVISNYLIWWNATSVHGPAQQATLDSIVQEIDIPTGLVLFQWSSLDHVPLSYSYQRMPSSPHIPYDPYHINSVDVDRDNNLIVSMRNTWAAYKVNHTTGAIMWELGGRHSSFHLTPGTYWAFQHDVRVRAHNDQFITMFDDDAGPPKIHPASRAIKLQLDLTHMTARSIVAHHHSPDISSNFEGNYQQLPNGDDFVGWGQNPYFTEYDKSGRLILSGQMNDGNSSYRAYRFQWNAVPWNLPAVSAHTQGRRTTVWVSWNGATGVSSWRVYGGASPGAMHWLTRVSKRTFETAINVPAEAWVQVQALDSSGKVIKSSAATAVH
ncbi:MAG TPA: arylsulfotransferase family protein [Solirubrobacteraceae bacterium]|nr:arylsulfotransferase family protein [Solirubrobacteraceae bacterium]